MDFIAIDCCFSSKLVVILYRNNVTTHKKKNVGCVRQCDYHKTIGNRYSLFYIVFWLLTK